MQPMNIDMLLPLELLEPGEAAEVVEVTGKSSFVHRMAEMGLRPGCRLEMLQGGSPCLLQMDGVRLSLRIDAEHAVVVRPLGAHEPYGRGR